MISKLGGCALLALALLLASSAACGGEETGEGLDGAHLVYQAEYASAPEGVYPDGDVLFVIAEVPPGAGERSARLARAMLRGKELLQEYTARHLLDESRRPAPCLLKVSFPQAVAFGRESVPGLGLPSFELSVDVRVLENREREERGYRYTVALRLSDLEDNVPVGLYAEPSQEEIVAALRQTWTARKKNDALGELCSSFQLAEDLARYGCPDSPHFPPDAASFPLPNGVPARSPGTVSPVTIARDAAGHADFSVMNASLPKEYEIAKQLYDRGVDLPRIITLSFRCAELAPANAAAWQLFGQALFADRQAEAALPFLAQALWLAPGDAEIRAALAAAYLACGRRDLAKGMAASVFFACQDVTAWSVGKATEILVECRE